jgi:hypothetical protein
MSTKISIFKTAFFSKQWEETDGKFRNKKKDFLGKFLKKLFKFPHAVAFVKDKSRVKIVQKFNLIFTFLHLFSFRHIFEVSKKLASRPKFT